MEKKFLKRYWKEEDITFYIEFINQDAVKQIELSTKGIFLTPSSAKSN